MAEELVGTDPCGLRPTDYRRKMIEFIVTYELAQIRRLLEKRDTGREGLGGFGNTEYHTFEVNATKLVASSSSLAFSVLHYPNLLLPIFEEAVIETQSLSLKKLRNRVQEEGQGGCYILQEIESRK